jgi:hypothetical protein
MPGRSYRSDNLRDHGAQDPPLDNQQHSDALPADCRVVAQEAVSLTRLLCARNGSRADVTA